MLCIFFIRMLHVPPVLRKMHTFDVHIYFHIIIRSHKRIFFFTSNQKLIRVLTKISEYLIEKKNKRYANLQTLQSSL